MLWGTHYVQVPWNRLVQKGYKPRAREGTAYYCYVLLVAPVADVHVPFCRITVHYYLEPVS